MVEETTSFLNEEIKQDAERVCLGLITGSRVMESRKVEQYEILYLPTYHGYSLEAITTELDKACSIAEALGKKAQWEPEPKIGVVAMVAGITKTGRRVILYHVLNDGKGLHFESDIWQYA